MRRFVTSLFALATLAGFLVSPSARAKCPNKALDDTLCEPSTSLLEPSVLATAYFPQHAHGPMLGGGLEVVLLGWSSNTEHFGPSHGKIRLNAMETWSLRDGERAVIWEAGAVTSFEKNPSRRVLIPYWGPSFGDIIPSFADHVLFLNATAGAFLYYTPSFQIDAEGSYALSLTRLDQFSGPRAQLTASFSLW